MITPMPPSPKTTRVSTRTYSPTGKFSVGRRGPGRHPGSVEKVHSLARSHVAQRRQRKTLAEHLATGARLLKTVAGHGGGMRSRESVLTGGAGGRDRRR